MFKIGKGKKVPREVLSEEKRSEMLEEEKGFFLSNGSRLLEELITSFDGKPNPIRHFSAEELQMATNGYDQSQIMRIDYLYIMYKGIHHSRSVLIKKYNKSSCTRWCINEMVIASQMNHKNILKVLGCCLETRTPILVYEYAESDLSKHIFQKDDLGCQDNHGLFSWDRKLRIATETANALAYLHMARTKPIIHRSMRAPNIFLNQQNDAKLYGFEFSVTIPLGKTHVEACYEDTIGFVAPECAATNQFTEKNDVYGFGAILLEIVTGNRVIDISKKFSEMIKSEESDKKDVQQLFPSGVVAYESFVKANIFKEGNEEQVMACGELSLRCLKMNPDERPTMKEVVLELRRIKSL